MKITNYDTSKLDEAGKYYNDGLALLEVEKQDELVKTLNELLKTPHLKDGYSWEKVMNSYALRPWAYDYHESVVNFLFDNDLPQKIEKYTGRNLILCHIQITKTDPGRSYQDWHRDSYQYGNDSWSGNTPPAHKIIFYPVNETIEPRLKFVRGSHRFMLNQAEFDSNVIKNFEVETLSTDNNRVLLFDTSLLHGVIPDTKPEGSIRVIYNFMSEDQYKARYEHKVHHKNLHDLYIRRLNK